MLEPKVAQNVAISLGYFIFQKNPNLLPKLALVVKNCPIFSKLLAACCNGTAHF
jgi:hypothetical protein